ncbi:hypothetical protein [Streptomyces sp. NPDC001880]
MAEVRERLPAAGCERRRSPLDTEPGRCIAQLRDPFGTITGITGITGIHGVDGP